MVTHVTVNILTKTYILLTTFSLFHMNTQYKWNCPTTKQFDVSWQYCGKEIQKNVMHLIIIFMKKNKEVYVIQNEQNM